MSYIEWVQLTFTNYRKEMKGINWGVLYNQFKNNTYDTDKLEKEIQTLIIDDDVTNKKGIYSYVLTRNEKYLNIRAFTENQKRSAYEKQNGICNNCGITPWHAGGKTSVDNCQMLCKDCNRRKSGK